MCDTYVRYSYPKSTGSVKKYFINIIVTKQAFGIFGKRAQLETRLSPGDRVEVYRGLAIDPKEARRRRAARKR